MNAVFQNTITELTREIAQRQDLINLLIHMDEPTSITPSLHHSTAHPEAPRKGRRTKPAKTGLPRLSAAPDRPAPQPRTMAPIRLPGDKPDTLGGAMKAVMHRLQQPFTQAQIRAGLTSDPDFAVLLNQSCASAFSSNLGYWLKEDYLHKEGGKGDETAYTIVDDEFFAPKIL